MYSFLSEAWVWNPLFKVKDGLAEGGHEAMKTLVEHFWFHVINGTVIMKLVRGKCPSVYSIYNHLTGCYFLLTKISCGGGRNFYGLGVKCGWVVPSGRRGIYDRIDVSDLYLVSGGA